MKILFLLPPSEGKNKGGELALEDLSFIFDKPIDIAKSATEKDLKCKGARYEEGIDLNKNISISGKNNSLSTISRYSGVMYNSIDYKGMNKSGKAFFEDNILILSGMYGIVRPLDNIGNYKLPIEVKGLYKFWGDKITDKLNSLNPEFIVNLLPGSYAKMINFKDIKSDVINVHFLHEKNGEIKKITHGVKKVKGEWLKNICENNITSYKQFGGEIVKNKNIIEVNIVS